MRFILKGKPAVSRELNYCNERHGKEHFRAKIKELSDSENFYESEQKFKRTGVGTKRACSLTASDVPLCKFELNRKFFTKR